MAGAVVTAASCGLTLPQAAAERNDTRLLGNLRTASRCPRQRVQDVDRVAQIEALAQPGRAGRAGVDAQALLCMPLLKTLDGIAGHRSGRRDVGQEPTIRSPELEPAVGQPLDLVALLVDRAMMPAALCRAPDYAEVGGRLDERAARGVGIIRSHF